MSRIKTTATRALPETSDLADDLRLVIGRLARRLRQQALGNMTPSQRSVLHTLDRYGPLRMGELAKIENISAPSLCGIVDRLGARDLVSRFDDPADARSTMVEATPTAIAELAAARAERTAFLVRGMSHLTDAEVRDLARLIPILDRLVEVE